MIRLILSVGIDKGECTPENLEKIKSFVPKSLEKYVIREYKIELKKKSMQEGVTLMFS